MGSTPRQPTTPRQVPQESNRAEDTSAGQDGEIYPLSEVRQGTKKQADGGHDHGDDDENQDGHLLAASTSRAGPKSVTRNARHGASPPKRTPAGNFPS